MKRKPDCRELVRQAIAIIEAEREIVFTSYKETDGIVRDYGARKELAKYDRWLKRAKAAIEVKPAPADSLLAWVYHRTRNGLFSRKRSERDKALSDVGNATQPYRGAWTPSERDPNKIWCGEQP